MNTTLIKNVRIVNEGKITAGDVLIKGERIERIGSSLTTREAAHVVEGDHAYLLPGAIDDQVHFREPGLTHKATIFTESRAAVAGGITSFMEMPNTVPPAFTQQLLEEKYQIAARNSLANYSFFMGTSNDNLEEVLRTDISRVCGLKIFMGSSTGNLLVDSPQILEAVFSRFPGLIATHCEHEATIRANLEKARVTYGENVPIDQHPVIRSVEACYQSSSMAVELAKKHGTHLHILHISTARETELFDNILPLEKKKITAEACIHHLWFSDADYATKGNYIKWNPAVKTSRDREAIMKAVVDDRIDVIATDHAPHTREEKAQTYFKAPSGGPLVQHSVVAMFELAKQGKITLEKAVQKLAHHPAILFRISERGFIREGYFADVVLVKELPWMVEPSNILAKCGWSPFEGQTFQHQVTDTWVNGKLVYSNKQIHEVGAGNRLAFTRMG
jgi:dihydroorotase